MYSDFYASASPPVRLYVHPDGSVEVSDAYGSQIVVGGGETSYVSSADVAYKDQIGRADCARDDYGPPWVWDPATRAWVVDSSGPVLGHGPYDNDFWDVDHEE